MTEHKLLTYWTGTVCTDIFSRVDKLPADRQTRGLIGTFMYDLEGYQDVVLAARTWKPIGRAKGLILHNRLVKIRKQTKRDISKISLGIQVNKSQSGYFILWVTYMKTPRVFILCIYMESEANKGHDTDVWNESYMISIHVGT